MVETPISRTGLSVDLTLWRYEDDDWVIKLTYEQDPLPAGEAERLRLKVLDAAAMAGMTVTAQSGMVIAHHRESGRQSAARQGLRGWRATCTKGKVR